MNLNIKSKISKTALEIVLVFIVFLPIIIILISYSAVSPTIKLDDTSTEVLADVYGVEAGVAPYEEAAIQIKFGNLSAIPSTAIINSAELCLYVINCGGGGCPDNDAVFERVLDYGWEEGIDSTAWNAQSTDNQNSTQTWNNTVAGSYHCIDVKSTVALDISGDNKNTTIRIWDADYLLTSVTSVSDEDATYKLAIGDAQITGVVWAQEDRENTGTSGNTPYLVIDYTEVDSTPPILTVINPANASVYTWYDGIDLNVTANENISTCQYSIEGNVNITMNKENATKWGSSNTTAFSGSTKVTFSCNDTSDNWNSTIRYFTGNVSANSSRCGKVYGDLTLTADISNNYRSCLIINTSDIVVNCNSFNITTIANSSLGVKNNGFDNVTVENCEITTSGSSAIGIYWYNKANNGTIYNNTIITFGFIGVGICCYASNNNIVNNTIITSGNHAYAIWFSSSSNSTLTNNIITTFGDRGNGIYFYSSSNNNLTGGAITTSGSIGYGIHFYSGINNLVKDSNVSASYSGIADIYHSSSGTNNLTNVTFSDSSVTDGVLNVHWYTDVYATNSSGNNLENVAVNITNKDGDNVYTGLTNASGRIARQEILDYFENKSAKFTQNNYTINGTLSGYNSDQKSVNISINKIGASEIVLTLTALEEEEDGGGGRLINETNGVIEEEEEIKWWNRKAFTIIPIWIIMFLIIIFFLSWVLRREMV